MSGVRTALEFSESGHFSFYTTSDCEVVTFGLTACGLGSLQAALVMLLNQFRFEEIRLRVAPTEQA